MFPFILAIAVATNSAERSLPAAAFHAVEVRTKATVRVEQSPIANVVATGDPRLVRCVTADIRDGRLVIGWAGRSSFQGSTPAAGNEIVVRARADCPHDSDPKRLTVHITAPNVDEVVLRNFGIIQVLPMRAATFTASIYERGNISIDGLHAVVTRLAIPGIGRIAATGELGRLGIAIGGDGIIDTRAAHAGAIDVSIAGQGNVLANVDGLASGSLGGAGVIEIGGHPNCEIRNPGHGRIVCPATL